MNSLKANEIDETLRSRRLIRPNSIFVLFAIAFIVSAAQLSGIKALICIAMGVYLIGMLTARDEDLFPFFLFFLPWSTILKISPTSFSFASVATILVFFKYLFVKKISIQVKPFLVFICICGYSFVVKLFQGYELTTSYMMLLVMFLAFPYLYNCVSAKMNFTKCVRCFSMGIILAAIISRVFSENIYLMHYIKIFSQENIAVTRLCGFYGDPNFYSAQIVTAFGGLLVILSANRKHNLFDMILTIALVVAGAISISKSYLLCTLLVYVLWGLASWRKPSKFIFSLVVISAGAFIVLASGILDDVITEYLARFGVITDASSLTTGRVEIWKNYLIYLFNHPFDLIFGQGCTAEAMVKKASHNTLIQLVYQFGVLGCILLFFWFKYLFTRNRKNFLSNIRSFMLALMWFAACFVMWFGLDMLFFDDFFLILILFFTGRNYILGLVCGRTE